MMIRFDSEVKDIRIKDGKVEQINDNKKKVMHVLERFFLIESTAMIPIKSYIDLAISEKRPKEELIPELSLLLSTSIENIRDILEDNDVETIEMAIEETSEELIIKLIVQFKDGEKQELTLL